MIQMIFIDFLFEKIGGDFAVPSREVSRGVLRTPFFGKVKVCEVFF